MAISQQWSSTEQVTLTDFEAQHPRYKYLVKSKLHFFSLVYRREKNIQTVSIGFV